MLGVRPLARACIERQFNQAFSSWLTSLVGSVASGERKLAWGKRLGQLREQQLKGLILAQNERWRRGLGMQVEREPRKGGQRRKGQ